MRSPFHDHEVHVRGHPLPGAARLFRMALVDAANLPTVTLPAGSPAVGRRLNVDDVIETDPERVCKAGDRLVIVGRPGSMGDMAQQLDR